MMSFFFFHVCQHHSQNLLDISSGARGVAYGGTKGTHRNIISLYGNDAGLAHLDGMAIYASAERRFNTAGLQYYSLLGAVPTSSGCWGATVQYFGVEHFNELLFGVTYSRKLNNRLALGTQFNYQQVRIPSYGKSNTLTTELGVMYDLVDGLYVGLYVNNPFEIKSSAEIVLPSHWLMSAGYSPSDKVRVVAELELVSSFRESIKFGMEYYIVSEFAIRVGFQTSPSVFTFGVGYSLGENVSFDFASTFHRDLGFSPSGGLGYEKGALE